MGVLPMHRNVEESEKNIKKGYANVFHGIGNNVGRNEWEEAFPTPYQHNVENASPDAMTCVGNASLDAVTCVGQSGVESSSPDGPYTDASRSVGNSFLYIFFKICNF
ncbi:hypothetical protein E5676_scaffold23G00130 [Cucumis melo var. makuwa]|uniref:Uncharacterized protein n=1 Tax=Cucumis melo var. makuwa TaxID=1194695 RepID=A0A5D3BDL7_CUCMM|nr:hypothetical protein E5676_scaffold23G00130 [Cucumis melo var. makuwa]